MWVKIKGQLINLNHIANMYWDERDDSIWLTLHPANRHAHNKTFNFIWEINEHNPDVIEEINNVSNAIAEATDTLQWQSDHYIKLKLEECKDEEYEMGTDEEALLLNDHLTND